MSDFGREFRELGMPAKRTRQPPRPPAGLRLKTPRNLNYVKIREDVLAAISTLSKDKQALIPAGATLPEMMVAYGCAMLSYTFSCQNQESGGRLRLGGSVVDLLIYFGAGVIAVRVQGDHWHSLPERKQKDAVQLLRLRSLGHRVWDAWEHAIYQAWVEHRFLQFVEQGVASAA